MPYIRKPIHRQLRKGLKKQNVLPTHWEQIWKLLNSSFVLWLLSSVVLSGVTYEFARFQEEQRQSSIRVERVARLDIEISNRLRWLSNALANEEDHPTQFKEAILIMAKPDVSPYPVHIFPEFRETSLSALMWELFSLVDDKHKREIQRSAENAGRLVDAFRYAEIMESSDDPFLKRILPKLVNVKLHFPGFDGKSMREAEFGAFNLKRWGSPFDFTFKTLSERHPPAK